MNTETMEWNHKRYPQPAIAVAPSRNIECIGCGEINTITGQWDSYAGKWYLGFNCTECGHRQAMWVKEPKSKVKTNVRSVLPPEED